MGVTKDNYSGSFPLRNFFSGPVQRILLLDLVSATHGQGIVADLGQSEKGDVFAEQRGVTQVLLNLLMKLLPKICISGITLGQFALGFSVFQITQPALGR